MTKNEIKFEIKLLGWDIQNLASLMMETKSGKKALVYNEEREARIAKRDALIQKLNEQEG